MDRAADLPVRRVVCLGAALLSMGACADLATEPDRVPSALSVAPTDTLITQGEAAQLRVTVLDQDGEPMGAYPSWAPPAWSISDPTALAISPAGIMDGLDGGDVHVDAELAGLKARFRVRVNPDEVGLSAPAVYLVQSIQNVGGDVPLVAGRKALLRVFATGDRVSFYRPRVRAVFYQGGEEVHTAWIESASEHLPAGVEEGRLDRSYNALVPAEVIQPGLEVVVHLDPDGVVPLAPGSGVRVPAQGRLALDVREVPPFELTLVPVLLSLHPDEQVLGWTDGLDERSLQVQLSREVHPIGAMEVRVREPYTSYADLTTDEGWSAFLREIQLLRTAEGTGGYWYGAVKPPPRSAWGGLGYVGYPASVGATSESTLAHELGHNLSLRHAPCGSVSSFDALFPYTGGSIGVWGFSFVAGGGPSGLMDPKEMKDLMGYCSPRWVSDYHFKKALAFRLEHETALMAGAGAGAPAPRRTLLVWGSAGEEGLLLEPAFAVDAPPVLPDAAGPYTVEGFDTDGRRRLSLRFAPLETSEGGGHFAFAVPVEPGWEDGLDRLVLSGPGGMVERGRSQDARAALVTDAATGRIRALVRDWKPADRLLPGQVVRLSDGLPVRGGGEGGR